MCKKQAKSEKRAIIAKKIKIKQKKGATLAGQLIRFKTAGKYTGKRIKNKDLRFMNKYS